MKIKLTKQQRAIVDRMKKEGKVNSFDATYEMAIKQAPSRIAELKDKGFKIGSRPSKGRSVDWYLEDMPKEEKPFTWVVENGLARKVYE